MPNKKSENNDAINAIQKLVFSRSITETVRRAIRVRLQVILDDHERSYEKWQENIKHRLNITRQKQVEREFKKRIQAMKITINFLTPYDQRIHDEPTFVVKKKKAQKLLPPAQKMIPERIVPQKILSERANSGQSKKSWNYLKP